MMLPVFALSLNQVIPLSLLDVKSICFDDVLLPICYLLFVPLLLFATKLAHLKRKEQLPHSPDQQNSAELGLTSSHTSSPDSLYDMLVYSAHPLGIPLLAVHTECPSFNSFTC